MDGKRFLPLPIAALVATLSATPPVFGDGPALPRYRLEPGQHLVYEGGEVAETGAGRLGIDRRAEIHVVRAGADGSWRLIVSQRHVRFTERDGEREDRARRLDLFVVDLTPGGRIAERASDTIGVLNRILPRLPADEREAREGWSFTAADLRHDCSRLRDNGTDACTFVVEPTSERDQINGFSSTHFYEFDDARGLVTGIEAQFRHQGRDTRIGRDRLVSEHRLDQEVLEALDRDLDVFVEADRTYRRRMAEILGSSLPQDARARLAEALGQLEQSHALLRSDLLAAHLGRTVEGHRRSEEGYLARISQHARFLGQAAPPWSLADLEGAGHQLSGYRGRVVILDFWYRNCGWCIRAMPQVQEVAAAFADRPVAVLGMNVDRNAADARFVADRLKIRYPTLLGDRALAQRYGVRSYPTLVVIDRSGVVRRIHVGYSATLAEELSDVVEELLAE